MTTELAIIEIPQENALQVFTAPQGLDPYLERIREEVRIFVPDVSTKKGRDAIASFAHKIAKSKTAVDNAGKALVDRLKEQPKLVDAERKRWRDEMDALKDEARRPLTEWESAEAARLERMRARIERFSLLTSDSHLLDAAELGNCIKEAEAVVVDSSWDEFETEGLRAKDSCLATLRAALVAREKFDAEQAELAKLRAEAAERAEQDRIAKEKADQAERERQAAEAARIAAEQKAAREQAEADAKAKREIEAAERQALESKLAAERAENARKEAEQREAQAKADAAAQAERAAKEAAERIAREQAAEAKRIADEQAARDRDTKHKKTINNAAVDALCDNGIDADTAKKVITLIAKKLVPRVSIQY